MKSLFKSSHADPVNHPVWAVVADIAWRIAVLTGHRIREFDDIDMYAWSRAIEPKRQKRGK